MQRTSLFHQVKQVEPVTDRLLGLLPEWVRTLVQVRAHQMLPMQVQLSLSSAAMHRSIYATLGWCLPSVHNSAVHHPLPAHLSTFSSAAACATTRHHNIQSCNLYTSLHVSASLHCRTGEERCCTLSAACSGA